jgi:hypothetical protein
MNQDVKKTDPVEVSIRLIILILGVITGLLVLVSVTCQLFFDPSYPMHIQGLLVFF